MGTLTSSHLRRQPNRGGSAEGKNQRRPQASAVTFSKETRHHCRLLADLQGRQSKPEMRGWAPLAAHIPSFFLLRRFHGALASNSPDFCIHLQNAVITAQLQLDTQCLEGAFVSVCKGQNPDNLGGAGSA